MNPPSPFAPCDLRASPQDRACLREAGASLRGRQGGKPSPTRGEGMRSAAEPAVDDVPGDAAAVLRVGGADGAAKRARGKPRIALLRREPADRLHAAEEGQRVRIGRQTLLLDNPGKRRSRLATGSASQCSVMLETMRSSSA